MFSLPAPPHRPDTRPWPGEKSLLHENVLPDSCTTDSAGQCVLATGAMAKRNGQVTFQVVSVSGAEAYRPGDNHDADGDSNGSSITIVK